jgi:hypothetical protein
VALSELPMERSHNLNRKNEKMTANMAVVTAPIRRQLNTSKWERESIFSTRRI